VARVFITGSSDGLREGGKSCRPSFRLPSDDAASPNKPAAKSLLLYLSSRDAIGELTDAGQGFDVSPFEKLSDFGIWAAAEPPKGTLYNFPRRRGSACRCIRKASGAR
jgi:hypothetical protein